MKGMILAAGFGTRFRPATYLIPKPLVPLCNRPLIGYAIDLLRGIGVSEIVINLHHFPDALEEWVLRSYPSQRFHFSREAEILGTGGGIRRVRSILQDEESFFLVNGDTLQQPALSELEAARREAGAVAALSLRRPPANDRFTKVFLDGKRITGFGSGRGSQLMFGGAHAIGREIFDLLPDRDFSGITEDVYIPLAASGEGLIGVVDAGPWFDIGTPERYLVASDDLRERMLAGRWDLPPGSLSDSERSNLLAGDSLASDRCTRSVLGAGVRCAPSARVEHSILWSGARLDDETLVRDAIVGEEVHLPRGSAVVNAIVCRRLEGVDYPKEMMLSKNLVSAEIDPTRPTEVNILTT